MDCYEREKRKIAVVLDLQENAFRDVCTTL